jgi:uroporphyrinogen decarboxylase
MDTGLTRFARALQGRAQTVPPIWLMRQAGRYHSHYQALRRKHSFEDICRTPAVAAEAALGPVRDFDFDAAILFSDLLFPLEALGLGLTYENGPPELDGPLTPARVARFRPLERAVARLRFQAEAVAETRALLPADKGLIGFVGGPWTLFVYGVEGSHQGPLARAKTSGALYRAFARHMVPLVKEQIRMQLRAGADVVMVLDTAAGDVPFSEFSERIARDLARLARAFPHRLGYYAKGSHPAQLSVPLFAEAPWAGLGVDGRWDLASTLARRPVPGFIQGNFDPALLHLTGRELQNAIHRFLDPIRALPLRQRCGWICGLGHGVLPQTPEESVRTFVRMIRRVMA